MRPITGIPTSSSRRWEPTGACSPSCSLYHEEVRRKRTLLRLDPPRADAVAVLPLSRNERLNPVAHEVADLLRPRFMIDVDDAGSIGRRYRRQDELGTPYAVTFDFDSLEDHAVTVRERDSMEQVRVAEDQVVRLVEEKVLGG
jgi:glycyl-tRNA synthetase